MDTTDKPAPVSVTLLLFASAREAAGTGRATLHASTVADVLEQARGLYGPGFEMVLEGSRVWLNGEPTLEAQPLRQGDEVAVLPPVSGG
jgi:molybdopterin synthase sulfur carrier subunit